MTDLRAFARELMADAERDLGTRLDWVAVDHWNTDNPHIHVLVRGQADDGRDLVISRDYISRGFRSRAEERVTLELGPRSEQEIQSALEKEVDAERWTNLDRALRSTADEGAGVANLRPGSRDSDPELRRLMIGRAAKLEQLGLAEQVEPGCWSLKPGLEETLRDLGIRGDVIKTMHRAMSEGGRDPDLSRFALQGDEPSDPVLGRFVARGHHDELKGSAYAIVDGIDGRTHYVTFSDLEFTGDAQPGAIVEARAYDDLKGRKRLTLATRSDFTLQQQITAPGATWLDRQLLARESVRGGKRGLWCRGEGCDGPAYRASRRRRARPTSGPAGYLRARSAQYPAKSRVERGGRENCRRDGTCVSAIGGGRADRRHLPPAGYFKLGPFRDDR